MNSRAAVVLTLLFGFVTHAPGAGLTMLPEWLDSQSIRNVWMLPDGRTLMGVDGNDVFRWTMSEGRTSIGILPTNYLTLPVGPTAVCDNGNLIIGYLGENRHQPRGGFFWTPNSGMTILSSPADGMNPRAVPTAVSSDGGVIVGNRYQADNYFESQLTAVGAFRWTIDQGTMPLDGLSYADAVNNDGSVVVGSGPYGVTGMQAVRWTQSTGSIGLGVMSDSWQPFASANFVSADGAYIVGYGFPPDARIGSKVFTWNESEGMQQLSLLGDDQYAVSISANAQIILGRMRTLIFDAVGFATTDDIFIASPEAGLQTLAQLFLPSNLDEVYPFNDGAKASVVERLSGDGRVVFGNSVNVDWSSNPYMPVIHREYWLLDLPSVPESSSSIPIVLGLTQLVLRCRVRADRIWL